MTKKPKALFIMYDGLTDPLGQSQVLPYLKKLSEYYRFDVIGFRKKKFLTPKRKLLKERYSLKRNLPILSNLIIDINRLYIR